jgi:putative oxidoreductase
MRTPKSNSKSWDIALWTAQIVLAAMFIMAGLPKTLTPIQELAATMPLAAEVPEALVRFIGISELLAAIGLVLPGVFRIKPQLISVAAAGLVVIMVLAILYHLAKGEIVPAGINVVLGLLAAFVAWGRFLKAPLSAGSRSTIQG